MSGTRRGAMVVAAAVVAVAITSGYAGAASNRTKSSKRVAKAATEFAQQGSARISGSVDVEAGTGLPTGTKISLPFTGTIDNRTKTGSFSFDMSSLGAKGAGALTEIMTNGALYMSVGSFGPKVSDALGGKHWVKIDMSELGITGSQTTQADPTSTLDGLRGVSNDAQVVGHDTVRGVDTTHYHATIDVQQAIARVPASQRARVRNAFSKFGDQPLPIDVWIDHNGLPRRYAMHLDVTEGTQTVSVAESFEFYDFGASVSVKAPPSDDTVDYSTLKQLVAQSQTS